MFLKKNKNWQPNTKYTIKVKIRYEAKNKMKICPHCIKTVGLIFFLGFNMFLIGYTRSFCYTRKKKAAERFGLGLRDLFVNLLTSTTKQLLCCCSVMSNFLQPRELQHVRVPCPSPSPGACLNSCPLIQ